jgi:hypothetical protein
VIRSTRTTLLIENHFNPICKNQTNQDLEAIEFLQFTVDLCGQRSVPTVFWGNLTTTSSATLGPYRLIVYQPQTSSRKQTIQRTDSPPQHQNVAISIRLQLAFNHPTLRDSITPTRNIPLLSLSESLLFSLKAIAVVVLHVDLSHWSVSCLYQVDPLLCSLATDLLHSRQFRTILRVLS